MRESVARFGQWASLVGVVTEPSGQAASPDAPAVLLLNAGLLHHVGPNRLHVRLARQLSRAGIRSLRFDLSSIGDSGPREDQMPRAESTISETRDAMDYLAKAHGHTRFVLFGICSGADQAVRAALADSRVIGIAVVDGYRFQTTGFHLHHYRRRLLRIRPWLSILTAKHPAVARLFGKAKKDGAAAPQPVEHAPQGVALPRLLTPFPARQLAEQMLRTLVERGGHLFAIFTQGRLYNHRSQFWTMFPALAKQPRVTTEYIENANHLFTLLASQDELIAVVERWMRSAGWIARGAITDSGDSADRTTARSHPSAP